MITIRGDGVAARCCMHLLHRARLPIRWDCAARSRLPVVMIGEPTQRLAGDVWGVPDLFAGAQPVRKRVVSWGRTADPAVLPHAAVVIDEETLLDRCGSVQTDDGQTGAIPDWTVIAAPSPAAAAVEHQFGSRTATVSPVQLAEGADPSACWIEARNRGWLFLLPAGGGSGWLLSVGDVPHPLFESRLVARQVAEVGAEVGRFPCHPRITEPIAGPGWLACGTAAVAFDPLCGDGCGYAIREAILASAVIGAVAQGEDAALAAAHYRARVIAGFLKHLEACREFYTGGGEGDWWRLQADALQHGIAWCRRQLAAAGPFRFRLDGFTLRPVG